MTDTTNNPDDETYVDNHILLDVLGDHPRTRMLAVFIGHPNMWFTAAETANYAGLDTDTVHSHLDALHDWEIINTNPENDTKYSVNTDNDAAESLAEFEWAILNILADMDELTRAQLDAAYAISDKNTAPENVETEPPEEDPLDPDLIDDAADEWEASTTPDERIRSVIKQTQTPTPVREIADTAAVPENHARDTLNTLAEVGVVARQSTDEETEYHRDPTWHIVTQARQLPESASITDQIERVRQEITEYRDTYGTDTPDEAMTDRELTDTELADISNWRTAERDLKILQVANALRNDT